MSNLVRPKGNQPSGIFGIYSAIQHRPVIREWSRSRHDAERRLAEIKAQDADEQHEEEEYYVVELSQGDVESYRQGGFIAA